jgi:hypothetical protein
MQVGVLKCIRDNSHRKTVGVRINHSKTNTIYADRAFLDRYITACCIILKCVFPAAIKLFKRSTNSHLVNMALHNMAIKPGIHLHASLQVYRFANFELGKIGFI